MGHNQLLRLLYFDPLNVEASVIVGGKETKQLIGISTLMKRVTIGLSSHGKPFSNPREKANHVRLMSSLRTGGIVDAENISQRSAPFSARLLRWLILPLGPTIPAVTHARRLAYEWLKRFDFARKSK